MDFNLNKYYVFPFSAKDSSTCRELLKTFLNYLHEQRPGLSDFHYSLAAKRDHLDFRYAVIAESIEELKENLGKILNKEKSENVIKGKINNNEKKKIVYICTGMGPQWYGMGRKLLITEPVFKDTILKCDEVFYKYSGCKLFNEFTCDESESGMDRTDIKQMTNLFIQIALYELLKSWGIIPDAVIGHSIGDIAAACLSKAITLDSAIKLMHYKSSFEQRLEGSGGMLAANVPVKKANDILNRFNRVSLAAVNSPASVTLSGNLEQLEEISNNLTREKAFNKFLMVKMPFHSMYMDEIKEDMINILKQIESHEPVIPFYSPSEIKKINKSICDASFWWKNFRDAVYFSDTIDKMIDDGFNNFIQIGPHPVLQQYVRENLFYKDADGYVFYTLHRMEGEDFSLKKLIASLYCAGCDIQWKHFINKDASYIKLPD